MNSLIKLPSVSIVICTLNCKNDLEICLKSIKKQDYPKKKIEIIVVDSYSSDGTLKVAKKYGAKIILTKIRGYMEGKGMPKSIGCDAAKGDIIITIDSDNALVEKDWIKKMIHPLLIDSTINYAICRMAVVKSDPIINQYLSFVGTDPFAIYGSLDPQITYGNVKLIDKGNYMIYNNKISNFLITGGYYLVFKKEVLKEIGGYTRDVDIAYAFASKKSGANIAIVKNAHLHHLITTSIFDFYKKKKKWGKYYFKNQSMERAHKWSEGFFGRFGKINFSFNIIKDLLFIPNIFLSFKMLIKYNNKSWLLHPFIKFLTVIAYLDAWISIMTSSKHK